MPSKIETNKQCCGTCHYWSGQRELKREGVKFIVSVPSYTTQGDCNSGMSGKKVASQSPSQTQFCTYRTWMEIG